MRGSTKVYRSFIKIRCLRLRRLGISPPKHTVPINSRSSTSLKPLSPESVFIYRHRINPITIPNYSSTLSPPRFRPHALPNGYRRQPRDPQIQQTAPPQFRVQLLSESQNAL